MFDYIFDAPYLIAGAGVFLWMLTRPSTSNKFISFILIAEIAYLYTVFLNSGNQTTYFTSAIVQLIALFLLSAKQGGGFTKVLVMGLYVSILFAHLLFYSYMPYAPRPYLDVVMGLSYLQMGVLLFSSKIEGLFYGGRISEYLTSSPVFGGLFRHWVNFHMDGSKKAGC